MFYAKLKEKVNFLWLPILSVLLVYMPFLGSRVLRTTGDDKVYVAQTWEMMQSGSWFLQRICNEPNYYKGPLHYILIRLGIETFGVSMWAALYMNLLYAILIAVSISILCNKYINNKNIAIWAAVATCTSSIFFAHMFASQMEIGLVAIYCLCMLVLSYKSSWRRDTIFWILAGVAGWLKSPLHSVLLGSGYILFLVLQGNFWQNCKQLRFWITPLIGIAICIIGYLPIYFLDFPSFQKTYLGRETFDRNPNGIAWWQAVIPLLTFSIFPWTFLALAAYFLYAKDVFKNKIKKAELFFIMPSESFALLKISVGLCLPTLLFFTFYPYRLQYYTLPCIGGVFCVLAVLFNNFVKHQLLAIAYAIKITSLIIFVSFIVILLFYCYFINDLQSWFSFSTLFFAELLILSASIFFWMAGRNNYLNFRLAALGSICLSAGFATVMVPTGEFELIGFRNFIKQNSNETIMYENLSKNIWSEWAYLNFMVPYPVGGIFNNTDLIANFNKSNVIIIPGEGALERAEKLILLNNPNAKFVKYPWIRWATRGRGGTFATFKQAVSNKSLAPIQKIFYFIKKVN